MGGFRDDRARAEPLWHDAANREEGGLRAAFEDARRRLATDLEAMQILNALGVGFIRAGNDQAENQRGIVTAAIAVMGADKANLQLLDRDDGTLQIVAQQGFDAPFMNAFARVTAGEATACGVALATREPVMVEDVEASPLFDETSRAVLREAGVRAVVSAPLVSANGVVLGVLSAHFSRPNQLGERDLGFMDLLARQAADYLARKRDEQRLQHVSDDLRQIFDSTDTGLTRCSRDLRYLSANPAYGRFAGLPPDRLVGRAIIEVMGEAAFDVIRPYVERVLLGERVEYEAELPFAAGQTVWARVVYTPTRDAGGEVVGWLASVSDLTEHRRAERLEAEQGRLLEAIASAAPLEACLGDLAQAAGRLLPAAAAAVVLADREGSAIERIVAPALPAAFADALRRLPIADDACTCGAAMFRREPVLCSDIAGDAVWSADWRAMCLDCGVRAVWSTPIPRPDGRSWGAFTLCFAEPRGPDAWTLRIATLGARVAAIALARDAAEGRLRQSEEQLRLAIEAADVGLWDVDPIADRLYWPPRVKRMFGISAELPVSMADFYAGLHPEDRASVTEAFAATQDPTLRALYDVEYRTVGKEDGLVRWVAAKGRGLFDEQGRCVRVIGTVIEISERKRQQERQRLLLNELDHRVKNTLATVQSIARQTLRRAPSAESGQAALESRLIALSRAHNVLTREHWETAGLREVVASALTAYKGGETASRFDIEGPDLRLRPKAALDLSLALHELATNAVKYGALSNNIGRVRLEWSLVGESARRFRLLWAESGGPRVSPPTRRGFGTRLIETGLAHDLGGQVLMTFGAEGLTCAIDAPADEVAL